MLGVRDWRIQPWPGLARSVSTSRKVRTTQFVAGLSEEAAWAIGGYAIKSIPRASQVCRWIFMSSFCTWALNRSITFAIRMANHIDNNCAGQDQHIILAFADIHPVGVGK